MTSAQVATISSLAALMALPAHCIIAALMQAKRTPMDPVSIWNRIMSTPVSRVLPSFARWTFSMILGLANPYSRVMSIRFSKVSRGNCIGYIDESRSLHNPFKSIHACALSLLAETVGGLTVFSRLDRKGDRAILKELNGEYLKKARGRIVAECVFQRPTSSGSHQSEVTLKDKATGDVVAKFVAVWVIDIAS